jgi:hypothetical protein
MPSKGASFAATGIPLQTAAAAPQAASYLGNLSSLQWCPLVAAAATACTQEGAATAPAPAPTACAARAAGCVRHSAGLSPWVVDPWVVKHLL